MVILFVYLFIYLFVYLFVCLFVFFLRAMFLAGEMMSSSELIPKFIALLCQITKGDFISKE